MVSEHTKYGIWDVYCEQCPSGNRRVKMTAGELKRLVDTVRNDWLEHATKAFPYSEFRKGLE